MHLPAPNFAFTIPSVYDGTQLDCRIHLPRHIQQPEHASTWQRRGAIVAHPYAPLGGCYDDPVVSFISAELLQSGCIVGTFNFRGAAGSEGRTSWTAKPELADYVSFYGFMLHYLRFGGDTTSTIEARGDNQEGPDKAHIILGGYSFGSLVASHLPQLDVIRDLFDSASSNDPGTLGAIRQIAHNLSSRTVGEFGHQKQQDSESSLQQTPKATISYLLVSPLLPPISLFLTLFAKFSLEVGMETSVQGKNIPCPKPTNQLRAHRALVIYGNEDAFTSASKLRNWADEISRESRGRFEAHEIDGASHFWREDGVEAQAQGILREWIRRLP